MKDLAPTPMGGAGGQVQADETYYGNTSKRSKSYRKGMRRKEAVLALVDPEKGQARAFHMEMGSGADVVRTHIVKNVSRKSTLVSDESKLYTKLGKEFPNTKPSFIGPACNTSTSAAIRPITSKTFSARSSAVCAAHTFIAASSIYSAISPNLNFDTITVPASVLVMENGRRLQ
jgi:hypothetical protein